MRARLGLVVSLVVVIVLGLLTYLQARSSLAGSREFNQWLGITASNKTWLWLLSIMVMGGSVGYLISKLVKRKTSGG